MKLIYPVDEPLITQGFGQNPQLYADPKYGGIKGHNGIDFLTTHGQKVFATHDGFAEYQVDNSGGHGVVITARDGEYKTIYWHFCNPEKEPKFTSPIYGTYKEVETGDLIGYADNTGASTGDHLHFGLKLCKNGETINKDNGYLGAVDPMLYFDNFTPTHVSLMKQQITLLQKLVNMLINLKTKFF